MDFDLAGFEQWLRRRGRSETTARHYVHQLRRSQGDVVTRLLDRSLAPNTRWLTMSAARQYARFAADDALAAELSDMRLPPAERVLTKEPLSEDDWRTLISELEGDDGLRPLERGALLILCRRGLRGGAIVALKRTEVIHALKSGTLSFHSKGRRLEYGVRPIRSACELILKEKWNVVGRGFCPRASEETLHRKGLSYLNDALRRAARRAGLDAWSIHAHRLRHTVATAFYRKTKDLVALQRYMQWASVGTAARYVGDIERKAMDDVIEELLR